MNTLVVVLRPEVDTASRTGYSHRAYLWDGSGGAYESLHLAGETELEARARVLAHYPGATITVQADAPVGTSVAVVVAEEPCCASCAQGRPCEGACHDHGCAEYADGTMAGETLLAVGEDEGATACVGCGCPGAEGGSVPGAIIFERMKRGPKGYVPETLTTIETPELAALFSSGGSCKGGACLPWVRVQRDPARFRAAIAAAAKLGPVHNSKQFYKLVKEYLITQDQEVFLVLLLDVHGNVRGIGEISRGARSQVQTPTPDVLRLPIVDGATHFMVAHNHPSGKHTPSKADDEVTKAIKKGAEAIDITFIDHLVIGANSYYSYHDHGKV